MPDFHWYTVLSDFAVLASCGEGKQQIHYVFSVHSSVDSLNLHLEEGSKYCQIIWRVEGHLPWGESAGPELRTV